VISLHISKRFNVIANHSFNPNDVKNATLLPKRRIVSNSVVNAKSDTTIDTICVDSGIVVLYSI
jgi:hypothetical protein